MAQPALDDALRFWDPVLHYALGSEHRNACLNEMIAVCPDLRRLLDDVRQFCTPREQGLSQGYGVQLRHLSYAATVTGQDVVYRFVQFLSRYGRFAASLASTAVRSLSFVTRQERLQRPGRSCPCCHDCRGAACRQVRRSPSLTVGNLCSCCLPCFTASLLAARCCCCCAAAVADMHHCSL